MYRGLLGNGSVMLALPGDLCEADAFDLDCVGKAIAAAALRDLDLA